MEYFKNPNRKETTDGIGYLNETAADKALSYHKSFPDYCPTPLRELKGLAEELNVGGLWVKDESYRFGLKAFKALGGSYAIGNFLAERRNFPMEQADYHCLTAPAVREALGDITFITATGGNHGRGVAWTAERLGQKAVVYLPKGASTERVAGIEKHGGKAFVTDMNYGDTVEMVIEEGGKQGWTVLQDTAWEGYETIPRWIMQGYLTMAKEADSQLTQPPTHIFLQAGVGSMAAAVMGYFKNCYGRDCPRFIIVEPKAYDCVLQSVKQGRMTKVERGESSLMSGLACGEVSTLAWPVLRDLPAGYFSGDDEITAVGMRILAAPIGGDEKVVSGESAALGMGVLFRVMTEERYKEVRQELRLDKSSRVLLFSTEGDTDRKSYRDIVWRGKLSLTE